jgi:hypothetical protein
VEGAGIAVRLQAAASLPNTPGGYVCTVSPADDLLFLARCPGGASNSCPIMKKIPASIDLGVAVLVRAAVVGNQVTCSLPQKGISFSYTDPAPFAGGGAGFVTFHASAMFDYLKVTPLP